MDIAVAAETASKNTTEMVTSEIKILKITAKGRGLAQLCTPNTTQGNAWKFFYRYGRTLHRASDYQVRKKTGFLTVEKSDMLLSAILHARQRWIRKPMFFSGTDSDDDGGITSLFQQPCHESSFNLVAPVKRLFTWGGVELLMELDRLPGLRKS